MGGGGKTDYEHQIGETLRMVPHSRTLRKARDQVKSMVINGLSSFQIRNYLHRWTMWWANTSTTWHYQELLRCFIDASWDEQATAYAAALSSRCQQLKILHMGSVDGLAVGA